VTPMPQGNWRQVALVGPYAVKTPRPERAAGAMCLNRWEVEIWNVWRPRFGWKHLCPVVWSDPHGHIVVMRRVVQDATDAEVREFEWRLMEEFKRIPSTESKAEDWGHLPDGSLVVVDYGYICDSEEAILQERAELQAAFER
jgi:hypothetical protein